MVERLHGVVGVADPAVAVVPVTLRMRRFGDRGGQRRDDRAGFLMLAQLERDRGADDRFLPVERGGETAHPLLPVIAGQLKHGFQLVLDVAVEGFVRAEEKVQRAFDAEVSLVEHITHGRVGGQAQRVALDQIADVVRAVGDVRELRAVAAHWRQDRADARRARHRAHDARIGDRAIGTADALETRAEIVDFDRAAACILQPGDEDRRVAHVVLAGGDLVFQFEPPGARVLPLVAAHQGAERRVAVDARDAAPDDGAAFVDQAADLAIADGPQLQRAVLCRLAFRRIHFRASPPSALESQSWTAPTSGSLQRAAVWRIGPTSTPSPPKRVTALNASSSVTSSPTKSGTVPENSSRSMNLLTALPLSEPGITSSTTCLPCFIFRPRSSAIDAA